jgi:hypothetical protein
MMHNLARQTSRPLRLLSDMQAMMEETQVKAGNLGQRGLRPLVGDQRRQLLSLRIVFATEMHVSRCAN